MDVTVYWSADGINAGAIDHYTSPYEEGWTAWRVEFWERQRGTWGVRIVRPSVSNGQHARREGADAPSGREAAARAAAGKDAPKEVFLEGLTSAQRSFPAYTEWLEENVDAIQVNGYPWWQSSRLGE